MVLNVFQEDEKETEEKTIFKEENCYGIKCFKK